MKSEYRKALEMAKKARSWKAIEEAVKISYMEGAIDRKSETGFKVIKAHCIAYCEYCLSDHEIKEDQPYSIECKYDGSIHRHSSYQAGSVGTNEEGNKCVMASPNAETFRRMLTEDQALFENEQYIYKISSMIKDADPILDEEELLLETIKDLDFQIARATKKLQDHHKDKVHYLNRLNVYRQGKTGKDPEQEQAERALIKRFADYLTIEKVIATTLARFIFVNEAKDSIEEVITMVVHNVIDKKDGSLHEGICDLIKTYPEAEISISVWNCEA